MKCLFFYILSKPPKKNLTYIFEEKERRTKPIPKCPKDYNKRIEMALKHIAKLGIIVPNSVIIACKEDAIQFLKKNGDY